MTTTIQYSDHHFSTTDEYPSAYTGGVGNLHVMHDRVTVGDALGANETFEMEFPSLLPGKVTVLPQLSWIRADDGDATADLHMGYRAYVDSNGDTQVADDNFWLDNVDVGGGDKQGLIPAITGVTTAGAQPATFDAQDGLKIVLMVDTADANLNDVYELCVVYIHVQ